MTIDNLKENWMPIALATLLGGGGATTANQMFFDHDHPSIIKEIRQVQYDGEIWKLTIQLEAMEEEGQKDSPSYKVAEAQLIKFTTMRAEL